MVYEVMTPEVLCCLETDDVKEAALIMEENQLRRILVLNESKHLVGIISLGELVTATGDRLLAGKILESVSDPSENKATADEIELEEGLTENRITNKAAKFRAQPQWPKNAQWKL